MGRELKRVPLDFDWPLWKVYDANPIERAEDGEDESWTEFGPPPDGEGYQVWETVSEGSPISPVFKTPEELATYMSEKGTDLDRGTYDQWFKFVEIGRVPSMMIVPGGGIINKCSVRRCAKEVAPQGRGGEMDSYFMKSMGDRESRTNEAMENPRPGDLYSEMCKFWVRVRSVTGSVIVEEFIQKKQGWVERSFPSLDDFKKAYAYGSIPGYWISLHERGTDEQPESQEARSE